MSQFKNFLLLEQNQILSNRISPLVNAIDELKADFQQMGTRQVIKNLTQIANEIRKIINDDWPDSEKNTIETLQKIAFFVLKSIDSSEEIQVILDRVATELYSLAGKDNIQINNL